MRKILDCVLLIDDNEPDNEYHRIIIKGMGVTNNIVTVDSSEEAINFLTDENEVTPDLIFLDIKMPRVDGWEFLEKYKLLAASEKRIPIIILSSVALPADVERAKKTGFVKDFKEKPLTREVLIEILNSYF